MAVGAIAVRTTSGNDLFRICQLEVQVFVGAALRVAGDVLQTLPFAVAVTEEVVLIAVTTWLTHKFVSIFL